jgi:putative ABC transport system ATP-binding protein
MSEKEVLTVADASKSVTLPSGEKLEVLHDVNLSVRAGESIAVRGRSGSGKTTLLLALGLFTPFDTGNHRLLGIDVRTAGDRRCSDLRARAIGFIFQDFRLLPNLSASENVEYSCILASMPRRQRKRAVPAALRRVGLIDRMESRPTVLSGGEQQRIAIARALVKQPALVLADEPTGSLDAQTSDVIMELLLEAVTEMGAALILVTHDLAVAARCHRQVYLLDGMIVTPASVASPLPLIGDT